jgi:hypothetical protein
VWQKGHTFIFESEFVIPWGLQFGLFCPLPKHSWCNTTVDPDGKFTRRSMSSRFPPPHPVEYSKGLKILTAQKCSGHTADHYDTYFHTLHPVIRTHNISRNIPFDKNSLQWTNESVTPSGDVIKTFNFTCSTPRQCLSHSSAPFNTMAIFVRILSNC